MTSRLPWRKTLNHTPSEQFAARFGASELGEDAAWFEWKFVLDAAREAERQLEPRITKS